MARGKKEKKREKETKTKTGTKHKENGGNVRCASNCDREGSDS